MKKNIKINKRLDRNFAQILGINLNITSRSRVLTRVRDFLSHNPSGITSGHKFYITTPNPELILMAQKDKDLRVALNSSDIAIPDGIGLAQAATFLSLPASKNLVIRIPTLLFQGLRVGYATFFQKEWLKENLNIIKGRVLFMDLINLANKKGWKVFLLGGEGFEAQDASQKLLLNYKNLKIEFHSGPTVNSEAKAVTEVDRKLYFDALKKINEFEPHLLFVAMQNPKQEKWIYKNIKNLNIAGAMTVGGTLRYIAGYSKLPPGIMERSGLEWLWRLIAEPYRIVRILRAVVIFPLKIFFEKLNKG